MRDHKSADITRLKRALGIAPNEGYVARTVSYEDALRITAALNLDPVDVDL
jgi:hypothetical protein